MLASGVKLSIPVELAISIASPLEGLAGIEATLGTRAYCTVLAIAVSAAEALASAVLAVESAVLAVLAAFEAVVDAALAVESAVVASL